MSEALLTLESIQFYRFGLQIQEEYWITKVNFVPISVIICSRWISGMMFWVFVARILVPEGNGTRGGFCERKEEPSSTLNKDNSPLKVQKRFEHSRVVAGFS